jgi:hypothetical protein
VAHHNENLFLINPITFALLPLGIMQVFGARRATVALQVAWAALGLITSLGVVLKVLPPFDQQNWNLICLVLPVNVLGAIAYRLLHRWQRTAVWTLR